MNPRERSGPRELRLDGSFLGPMSSRQKRSGELVSRHPGLQETQPNAALQKTTTATPENLQGCRVGLRKPDLRHHCEGRIFQRP